MDFFASQDRARRNTGLLIFYFAIAVALIVASVYLVIAAAFLGLGDYSQRPSLWNPELFMLVALGTIAVVSLGSLYKISSLSSGGHTVAELFGGRLIDTATTDPKQRRVLNVVEEMAIASGTPVPPVYLLADERGINAFAAGFAPSDAVITVTQGTVDLLTRDELQGVVAHEFSHILRGDMRLNIRLMGVLYGILVISMIGWIIFRTTAGASSRMYARDSNRKGGNPLPLVGLALFVIGYVGVFFGKLIKSAVSRQREFMADASAVQFTRNPDGIAGALKKIGGARSGSRIRNAEAEEASHMFFGDAMAQTLFSWMATHPPLAERIRRIDPRFDGMFPEVAAAPFEQGSAAAESPVAAELVSRAVDAGPIVSKAAAASATVPFGPQQVAGHVGAPRPEHVDYAAALLASLPVALTDMLHETTGARAVVYALLLDNDQDVRQRQLAGFHELELREPGLSEQVAKAAAVTSSLGAGSRLPIVELAIPALRLLSPNQFADFDRMVRQLVEADRRMSLFEYALQRMLLRHLAPRFTGRTPPRVKYQSLAAVGAQATCLLSVLAYAGNDDDAGARAAFEAGVKQCFGPGTASSMIARGDARLKALDASLSILAQASSGIKRRVLTGCTAAITVDGRVTVEEGELLRAIADSLDCPMPPLGVV
jgi:Zn-dependent protease with chaperone function